MRGTPLPLKTWHLRGVVVSRFKVLLLPSLVVLGRIARYVAAPLFYWPSQRSVGRGAFFREASVSLHLFRQLVRYPQNHLYHWRSRVFLPSGNPN
jgi:hypothetical protein